MPLILAWLFNRRNPEFVAAMHLICWGALFQRSYTYGCELSSSRSVPDRRTRNFRTDALFWTAFRGDRASAGR